MPMPEAMQAAESLNASVETAAALCARLARDHADAGVAPGISRALDDVAAAHAPGAFDGLSDAEAEMIRAFLGAHMRQALDLLERPDRPAARSVEDPALLQARGRFSRIIPQAIAEYAGTRPELAERLARPGRFLDVGSGVGCISLDLAARWPALEVDGIDVFPSALALAAENLAAAGPDLAGRVAFRARDVVELDAEAVYAAAFLPLPWIPHAAADRAVTRLHRALEPGGRLFFGLFKLPPEPLPRALADLRIARSGGHPWTLEAAETRLRAEGFGALDFIDTPGPVALIAARKG